MSVATLPSSEIIRDWVHPVHTQSDRDRDLDEIERSDETLAPGAGFCFATFRCVVSDRRGHEFWLPTTARPLVAPTLALWWGIPAAHASLTPSNQFARAHLGPWECAVIVSRLAIDPVEERPAREAEQLAAPSIDDPLWAVDELRDWLGLTYEDLEAVTGIARNTFHHWRRTGATPRPSTVRKLRRVHALVRALIARLGRDEAVAWLRTGPDSPVDLMLRGDLESAEAAAQSRLFRHPPASPAEQPDYSPFRLEPEFDVPVATPAAGPPRRAKRRPTRSRLPRP